MNYANRSKRIQIEALEQLKIYHHICSLYETKEDQFSIIVPLIKIGLERGEKCIYVVNDNTVHEVQDAMQTGGIDTDSALKSGSLSILNGQEFFLHQDPFEPDWTIQFLKETIDLAKSEGFNALRLTAEMTWLFGVEKGTQSLSDYEFKMNSFFHENDIVMICQYNLMQFLPETILNIIRIHPVIAYGGVVCKNFYYVPHDEYLKSDQTSLEIEHLLDNLRNNKQRELDLIESEERFKASEKKIRAWLEYSPVCTKIVDLDFNLQYMSSAGVKGLKIEDITQFYGKPYPFDFYPESFRNLMNNNLEKVKETGDVVTQEAPVFDIKGNELWFHSTLVPVNDDEGRIDYIIIVSVDTTERKKTEKLLKESEKKTLLLLNSTGEAIYGLDLEGKCTFCNPSCLRLLGYEDENQLLSKNMHDLIHHTRKDGTPYPEEECCIYQAFREGKGTHVDDEVLWRADGTSFAAEYRSFPIFHEGETVGSVVSFVDITERKKAEELKNLHTNMLELNAEIGVASTRRNTMRLMLQEFTEILVKRLDVAFARIWTLNKQENMLKLQASAGMYTHIDGDHSRVPVGSFKIGLIAKECKPHITNDVINDKRISNPEWAKREGMVAFAGHPLIVEGHVVGVMAMFAHKQLNISIINSLVMVADKIATAIVRKHAEEEVKSLSKFPSENPNPVLRVGGNGTILFANNASSILLDNWDTQTGQSAPEDWHKHVLDVLRSGTSNSYEVKCNDFIFSIMLAPIVEEGYVNFYCRDITERKKMEEALLQSEKLKSIGTITSGVAHEFNNILAIISGNAQLLEGSRKDDKELIDAIRTIKRATNDGAEISRRMLKFAKIDKDTSGFVPFDINELINQAIDFTMPRWKNIAQAKGINYHVDTEGMKRVPSVLCNSTELREVFVNIINNALDAMPDDGRITFRTWSGEDTVFISISDTGEGMSEEVRKNIFDPFFTTKIAVGTGLGMSTAYSIVTRHGGKIEVESEVGKGSTFNLQFPAAAKADSPKESSEQKQEIKSKELRILVVDDEEEICNILDKFFSKKGHMVRTVDNGREAIILAKATDYDLVLCDLSMPDVYGYDVIRALDKLEKRPKIGIITGWGDKLKPIDDEELKVDFIIKKPFDFLELARHINDLLKN